MNVNLNTETIDFDLLALACPIIILIGPPGAGKTAVGRILADDLHWQFWDTDAIIEKATSMKITDIFSKQGEKTFRSLENALVKHILSLYQESNNQHATKIDSVGELNLNSGTILSCGGGLPVQTDNFLALSQLGTIVALKAPANVLIERVKDMPHRPLLDQTNVDNDIVNRQSRLESLIEERKSVYAKAHFTIDTNNQTVANVSRLIKAQLALI